MWQEEYEEYTKDDESHDEDEYYGGGEEEEQQSRIPVNTTDNLTYDLTNRIKALDARNHLNNLFQTRDLYNKPVTYLIDGTNVYVRQIAE